MSLHQRLLLLGAATCAAALLLPGVASFAIESEPTISALGSYTGFYWNPSTAEVKETGKVTFQNMSTSVPHGIIWKNPPTPPTCDSSVPVGTGKWGPNWKGSCTFSQAGTYSFYCSYHGEAMSGTITVRTPSNPTATTNLPTEVTQTSAILNGTVHPEGTATSYYFAWGTTNAMTEKIPLSPQSIGSDFSEHQVTASLTNLLPNTEYHYKLVATYAATSKAEGIERTFLTHPLERPTVTTKAVTPKETEATIEGTIDPGGETTKYSVEYGTSTSYGQKTEEKTLSSPVGVQAVSASLAKLAPGTEYHFRLVAKNVQGGDESVGAFTTASPPAPKSEPPANEPAKEASPTPTPTPSPTPSPIAPAPEIAPLVPALVGGSLKLTVPRHGSSVHGSLDVSSSAAGGRLEIDLIASSASLAKERHKKSTSTVVGRLVRSSVSEGKLSFSIALNAQAKNALRRRHKLALTVKVTLTPPHGPAEVLTKSILLRA